MDFNPGVRSLPMGAAVVVPVDMVVDSVVVMAAMVVEGDTEITPHLGGHQDFKVPPTEGVAFEVEDLLLEDTIDQCYCL